MSEDFAEAIVSQLKAYTNEQIFQVINCTDNISKKVLRKVKNKSPRLTGDYKKGWVRKILRKTNSGIYIRLHQKGREASLTHLLEEGHASRRPGRRVRAIPHIQQVENEANIELAREIDRILER